MKRLLLALAITVTSLNYTALASSESCKSHLVANGYGDTGRLIHTGTKQVDGWTLNIFEKGVAHYISEGIMDGYTTYLYTCMERTDGVGYWGWDYFPPDGGHFKSKLYRMEKDLHLQMQNGEGIERAE